MLFFLEHFKLGKHKIGLFNFAAPFCAATTKKQNFLTNFFLSLSFFIKKNKIKENETKNKLFNSSLY